MPIPYPLSDAPQVCRFGVEELAAMYARRDLSPVEVVSATIERAREVNTRFNAFAAIDSRFALQEAQKSEARWRSGNARSPIDGVPSTVKDVLPTKGFVVRWGSHATDDKVAETDAPAVAALRRDGAIVIGMTTTPEFGWKGVTDSPLSGITRNPWDETLTPGGSSGGAAVAAATGAGVLHIGTDGGGSNRIPAAFTGTVGMKPTFGRVAVYPASWFGTVSHVGPIARSVSDAAYMLESIAGRDTRDWTQGHGRHDFYRKGRFELRGARVGYWGEPVCGKLDHKVGSVIDKAVRRLLDCGAEIEALKIPDKFDLLSIFQTHWLTSTASLVNSLPMDKMCSVDPGLRRMAERGSAITALALFSAQLDRIKFGSWMDEQLEKFDFIISPATSTLPFEVGCEVPPDSELTSWIEWAGFTFPINLSQHPACVIPVGSSDRGLPVAMQVVGARGNDEKVIAVSAAIERLTCVSS